MPTPVSPEARPTLASIRSTLESAIATEVERLHAEVHRLRQDGSASGFVERRLAAATSALRACADAEARLVTAQAMLAREERAQRAEGRESEDPAAVQRVLAALRKLDAERDG